jgi:hypothetical protein
VDHLERHTLQKRQRFDERLINSAGALTAAHHQQCGQFLSQSEFPPRICAVQRHQFSANRCAGDFGARFRKKRRAFLETQHNGIHHPRGPTVRFSRDGVRFVNKRGYSAESPGQDWRGGRESAHAQNGMWIELAIDRPAK